MKCYHHNDIDAVATCNICGRGLCTECADKYHPPICNICLKNKEEKQHKQELQDSIRRQETIKTNKRYALWGIIWHVIFLGLGICALFINMKRGDNFPNALPNMIFYWGISGVPWLYRIGYYGGEPAASCLGIILKLLIGFCIGAIASPILLFLNVKKLMQNRKERSC